MAKVADMLFCECANKYAGQHPRNTIAGLKGPCICSFDRYCHMALYSGYTNLPLPQQRMRCLLPRSHYQNSYFSTPPTLMTIHVHCCSHLPRKKSTQRGEITCLRVPSELREETTWRPPQVWCGTSQFTEHFPLDTSSQYAFTPGSQPVCPAACGLHLWGTGSAWKCMSSREKFTSSNHWWHRSINTPAPWLPYK